METSYFRKYYWDHGRPRGAEIADPAETLVYRVIVDPYYKRYSVEQYKNGRFSDIIYDSALYDFRWLKPREQIAWRKETIEAGEGQITCLIRNQDDRAIALEKYTFQAGLCTLCEIYYPHGPLLATQRMMHTKLGAAENSVVLLDRLFRPVVIKNYEADETTGEFTTLIREVWNTKDIYLFF